MRNRSIQNKDTKVVVLQGILTLTMSTRVAFKFLVMVSKRSPLKRSKGSALLSMYFPEDLEVRAWLSSSESKRSYTSKAVHTSALKVLTRWQLKAVSSRVLLLPHSVVLYVSRG